MAIPTIYCEKKQALPLEDITVTASIGEGEWSFNADIGTDIRIVSGDITDNTITFHTTRSFDPLIINFLVIENVVLNGAAWVDTADRGIGDNWTSPLGQSNSILNGWNFTGNSQRVDLTISPFPSISQDNLTVSGGDYKAELDYRAFVPIELSVGGHIYELPRTNEGPPFAIYPIQHEAGVINFEVADATNPKWILSDGVVVNGVDNISKNLPAGTTYLLVDDFIGTSIGSNATGSRYIGSLSDIPSGLSVIELADTDVYGDIIEIGHIQDVVFIPNSGIYGNIEALSGVSTVIDLSECESVYGDISSLTYTLSATLDGTSVSGAVSSSAEATYWSLNNTNLDKTELEISLVNISTRAEALSEMNGYFECYDNMPTVDSVEACDAIGILKLDLNWHVMVHSSCGGSGGIL